MSPEYLRSNLSEGGCISDPIKLGSSQEKSINEKIKAVKCTKDVLSENMKKQRSLICFIVILNLIFCRKSVNTFQYNLPQDGDLYRAF